jgi:hypothetical protein
MKQNHRKFAITASLALLFLAGAQARTWTSADGTRTFEGELHTYDPATGMVAVKLPNGKEMNFLQDKLSADDIAFLKETGKKVVASPASSGTVKDLPDVLPDPDGKEADMSKPVQVYILMGQSNMLGFGKPARCRGSPRKNTHTWSMTPASGPCARMSATCLSWLPATHLQRTNRMTG